MGGGGWGGRRQLGVAEISPVKACPAEAMETSPGGRQVQPLEKERGLEDSFLKRVKKAVSQI